jgi:TonB family protein
MLWIGILSLVSLFTGGCLKAQASSGLDGAIRLGPGVTPPRLLHKVEPEYSPAARADHIQGTVVLELAVDEQGRPTGITVISPLGFGLDERAQSAVETWRFAPGVKDGKPVKILATVEVNFRFPEIWFDAKAEHQRTSFNVAVQTIKRSDSNDKALDRAVKSIQDLSRQKFPPAMYLMGTWETAGEHVTQDAADGLELIQKAAAKNYGPAMYETAIRRIEGRDLPKDGENGLKTMREASVLGSAQVHEPPLVRCWGIHVILPSPYGSLTGHEQVGKLRLRQPPLFPDCSEGVTGCVIFVGSHRFSADNSPVASSVLLAERVQDRRDRC